MTQILNARIPALAETVFPVFTEMAKLFEADCASDADSLSMKLGAAEIRLAARSEALTLTIAAEDERRLYLLQQIILNRLDSIDPAPQPEWEKVRTGELPPNLSIATVDSVTAVSPNFRRIRVRFPEIARYAEKGLHFRLVISALPPDQAKGGSVTRWPVVGASGRTQWPEGEFALHRPVYTLRAVDAEAGWMAFDVFLHEGGRVSGWTDRVAPGDRIGLMGPTTRQEIAAGWVGFWGDETSLPAIIQYCGALAPETKGVVRVALGDPADRQDFARPAGVELAWLERREGGLLEDLKAAILPAADRFVFFAAEGAETDQARTLLREERGFSKQDSLVVAYWRKGDEGEA